MILKKNMVYTIDLTPDEALSLVSILLFVTKTVVATGQDEWDRIKNLELSEQCQLFAVNLHRELVSLN